MVYQQKCYLVSLYLKFYLENLLHMILSKLLDDNVSLNCVLLTSITLSLDLLSEFLLVIAIIKKVICAFT